MIELWSDNATFRFQNIVNRRGRGLPGLGIEGCLVWGQGLHIQIIFLGWAPRPVRCSIVWLRFAFVGVGRVLKRACGLVVRLTEEDGNVGCLVGILHSIVMAQFGCGEHAVFLALRLCGSGGGEERRKDCEGTVMKESQAVWYRWRGRKEKRL